MPWVSHDLQAMFNLNFFVKWFLTQIKSVNSM